MVMDAVTKKNESLFSRLIHFRINLIVIFGFVLLPLLLTFGSNGASYQKLFEPQKRNPFYDAMQLAVFSSIGLTEIAAGLWFTKASLLLHKRQFNAFKLFQLTVSLLLGILYFTVSCYLSGFFWIFFCCCLLFSFTAREELSLSWKPNLKRGRYGWFYTFFFVFVSAGFLAFPVAQPWSGFPEPFIRWHPYTVNGELIWRGIFFSYASAILYSCAEDPLGKHFLFVFYVGISCIIHSITMLGMNINQRLNQGSNGNFEHLVSEIPGFLFLGILNLIGVWLGLTSSLSTISYVSIEEVLPTTETQP